LIIVFFLSVYHLNLVLLEVLLVGSALIYPMQRSQRIAIRGTVSEKFDVPHGVPQGSCLGPLLFTIYASKLFDVIEKHLPISHCYADDTQLYIAFSPTEERGESDAVIAMERCIEDIRVWMSEDKLIMNADKT
jgi:hypothetical protein